MALAEILQPERPVDPAQFRQVLGSYPTGVAVISAVSSDGTPLGMTVGSFASVSLEPPLVSFMASVTSSSWRALRETDGRFCVNVLAADQEEECLTVARRKTDKFENLDWEPGPSGLPVLRGALAVIDCDTEVVHTAGDHDIVIGRVRRLDHDPARLPLLFFRGGYGSFRPRSIVTSETVLPQHLGAVEVIRPELDVLAARTGGRVSVTAVKGEELIVLATAGWGDGAPGGWVGQRLPFMAPVGSVHAAWGDPAQHEQWLRAVPEGAGLPDHERLSAWVEAVRARGYALALGHTAMEELPQVAAQVRCGDGPGAVRRLAKVASHAFEDCYPLRIPERGELEFRSATVPLVHDAGVLGLSVWGPPGATPVAEVEASLGLLREAGARAQALLDAQGRPAADL